jgi:hypothetical protein
MNMFSSEAYRRRVRRNRRTLGYVLGAMGVICLVTGPFLMGRERDEVAGARAMTIAEALAQKDAVAGPVRLTGRIEGESLTAMPDTGEPVVRGELRLAVTDISSGRGPLERALVDWSGAARSFALEDERDGARIDLLVDAAALPLDAPAAPSPRAVVRYEGTGRSAAIESVELAGRIYPLAAGEWSGRTPSVQHRRATLAPGHIVTVIAGIGSPGAGTRLVRPPGHERIQVFLGDAEEIAERAAAGRRFAALAGVLLCVAGVALERSNRPVAPPG